jgi:hypothetical protein
LAAEQARTTELRAQLDATGSERDQALAERQERDTRLQEAIGNHLAAHRRALLAENQGQVIAELVNGSTVEDLEASIAVARSAYARIAQDLRAQAASHVPVGAAAGQATAPEELSALAKITQGLTRNGR